MSELKSIEKPKLSKARNLLRETGYQDNNDCIIFSFDEWCAIEDAVKELEKEAGTDGN